ncbi:MAG: hypothetical protein P4M05_33585 [Bradyrhizobium sp.]|nr:hypothetical protein [Bradyrhizobium sp.]
MTDGVPAGWIRDGDKYALMALSVKVEGPLPLHEFAPSLSVLGDTAFTVPSHWREWLGTIRVEEIEACNLFLLSTQASRKPDILDEEHQLLDRRVWHFYVGLLLASRFAPAHKPVMLSGACIDGEIGVRSQKDFDVPTPCMFRFYPSLLPEEIEAAAQLGTNIEAIVQAALPGGHWRLFRTLTLYTHARTIPDPLERTHQYCRCIDGLILPDAGKTAKQFKSRTELFMGPGHHEFMGELYDVRSAVEHLHENRYLEVYNRTTRLDLIKKEAIAEYVARSTLTRIIGNQSLWPHFGNTAALAQFWKLPEPERRALWGNPIDPLHAIAEFDPKYIPDDV